MCRNEHNPFNAVSKKYACPTTKLLKNGWEFCKHWILELFYQKHKKQMSVCENGYG